MIRSIKIENFKSIRSETVKLGKFHVLFGSNGSGKTNFVASIVFAKNLAEGQDIATALNKIAPFSLELFYAKERKKVSTLTFELQAPNNSLYEFTFSVAFGPVGDGGGDSAFKIVNESLKKRNEGEWQNIYERKDTDTYYSGENLEEIPFKVDSNKLMLSSFSTPEVSEVSKIFASFTFVEPALENRQPLLIVSSNRLNAAAMEDITVSLYRKNNGRFDAAVKSVQKIIPSFVAPEVQSIDEQSKKPEEAKRYFVTWHEKDIPYSFTQQSISHGDRRVIHLLFSLFNAEEYSFLALEELENGMHIGRIRRLLDEFRTQAANRKIQILLTSHSHEIFNQLSVNEAIYCKKIEDQGTKIVHLADSEEYKQIKSDLETQHTAGDLLQTGLFD